MTVDEIAQQIGCTADDLRALVRAADIALQEYGTDDDARAARRAAEALGLAFKRDHGLGPENASTSTQGVEL